MKNARFYKLQTTVAPIALSLALIATPAAAQDINADNMDADSADTTAAGDDALIVVTGSRIARPDVEASSPVAVVSSQDIKLQGTTRIEDVLNSLPAVAASQASSLANGADGTATVDLRGLGSTRTLTLINGRRLVPGDPSPTSGSAADINIIPAAMLKQVEVLTGGASSVYGADAVAGVVNFIIDDEFEGFRIDAQYGVYQHDNNNQFIRPFLDARGFPFPDGNTVDGGSVDATVAFGSKFADDRGHFMIYGGYRKINAVTQAERDFSSCVLQNVAGGANRCGGSATTPNGNVLVFDTAVTTGTSTFYTFAPNRGFVNGLGVFNFAPFNHFQRPDERFTGGAFVKYEVSDSFRPYMEFQFMDNQTVAQIAPSGNFGNTLTLNCDNPLMSAAQRAVICDTDNLISGYVGTSRRRPRRRSIPIRPRLRSILRTVRAEPIIRAMRSLSVATWKVVRVAPIWVTRPIAASSARMAIFRMCGATMPIINMARSNIRKSMTMNSRSPVWSGRSML